MRVRARVSASEAELHEADDLGERDAHRFRLVLALGLPLELERGVLRELAHDVDHRLDRPHDHRGHVAAEEDEHAEEQRRDEERRADLEDGLRLLRLARDEPRAAALELQQVEILEAHLRDRRRAAYLRVVDVCAACIPLAAMWNEALLVVRILGSGSGLGGFGFGLMRVRVRARVRVRVRVGVWGQGQGQG